VLVQECVADAVRRYGNVAPVVSCFYAVRDLPYALDGAHDGVSLLRHRRGDCLAKSDLMMMASAELGVPCRFVRWQYLLPEVVPEAAALPSRVDVHRTVQLKVGGSWLLADPTHHPGLRQTALTVSDWDGEHDTDPGYPPVGPLMIERIEPAAVRDVLEEVRLWTASCPAEVAAWRTAYSAWLRQYE
jgi:transglutaminase-like putative cysteine protease